MATDPVIHIIDDDDAIRDSLGFLLESAGFATIAYPSAEQFLEAAPQLSGGCIVTDLRMPGVSGLDLTRQLRGMRVALPIIMITGHGDVPLAVEAMKAGATDFLEKPFDADALVAAKASTARAPFNRLRARA